MRIVYMVLDESKKQEQGWYKKKTETILHILEIGDSQTQCE